MDVIATGTYGHRAHPVDVEVEESFSPGGAYDDYTLAVGLNPGQDHSLGISYVEAELTSAQVRDLIDALTRRLAEYHGLTPAQVRDLIDTLTRRLAEYHAR